MASTACIPPAPASGDAVGLRERARGALLGLAVGDALGAPAENMKPSEIRARWGRITGYVAKKPAGTDDTEYAIFSGLLLARYGSALTPAHVETAWHEWIADREEGPFRGAGFSERGTLENLRRGLAAPVSAQHRHAWSDGLAMRAAPHGVFAAGRPAEAARLVAIDGSVSHDGEGIYGGQAVAAGVAAAMAGAPPVAVVASALAVVPDDSWTARCLRRAMTAAHLGERAVRSAVVIGGYPWTDLAPEAVALAFGAYAAADGDFTDAVLTAVNMGRDADTTAAVAGALAGATQGAAAIPAEWAAAIGPARGSCLPAMAGHHVLEVADLLTRDAEAPEDRSRTTRPGDTPRDAPPHRGDTPAERATPHAGSVPGPVGADPTGPARTPGHGPGPAAGHGPGDGLAPETEPRPGPATAHGPGNDLAPETEPRPGPATGQGQTPAPDHGQKPTPDRRPRPAPGHEHAPEPGDGPALEPGHGLAPKPGDGPAPEPEGRSAPAPGHALAGHGDSVRIDTLAAPGRRPARHGAPVPEASLAGREGNEPVPDGDARAGVTP
ncbi:ADP-ribosylglycohydrolase family protein [Streptomyces sp. NPDC017454]|uniref:ADP-ribosylglycohydrolase family protein n=1 Tax=Streptomyces sp. NPDC017454 TaxID=3364997 RepID=UPI0037A47CF8